MLVPRFHRKCMDQVISPILHFVMSASHIPTLVVENISGNIEVDIEL